MLSLLRLHPRTLFQSTCSAPVPRQLVMGALFLRHTALLTGVAVEWVFTAHLFPGLWTSPRLAWMFRKWPLSMALQTASPPQATLCSLECCSAPEVRNMQSHIILDIHHSWRAGMYLGLYLPLGMPWALGSDLNTPVGVTWQFLPGFWTETTDTLVKMSFPVHYCF